MPLPKPLTKEQILAAMSQTKSNRAASRWLHVSYQHYKKWAKSYTDQETGKTLFEKHLNQEGKGIAKFLNNSRKIPALMELLEGQVPMTNFNPDKVKKRLFEEGYLQEECSMCGFNERRLLDYKIPLLLHFKDNNKKNWRLENLEVLCYNHYFLTIGDIFSVKDEEQIETSRPLSKTTDAIDFELDDYQIQRLRELGLYDPPKGDDDLDLISRI
jgi:hypothetical protein